MPKKEAKRPKKPEFVVGRGPRGFLISFDKKTHDYIHNRLYKALLKTDPDERKKAVQAVQNHLTEEVFPDAREKEKELMRSKLRDFEEYFDNGQETLRKCKEQLEAERKGETRRRREAVKTIYSIVEDLHHKGYSTEEICSMLPSTDPGLIHEIKQKLEGKE
jgi:hypothetical protein